MDDVNTEELPQVCHSCGYLKIHCDCKEKNDAFIGGYVPRRIKTAIKNEATNQGRNFSQQLIVILKDRYNPKEKRNGKTKRT